MPRCFTTDGPSNAATHYMLPPLRRLPEVHSLFEKQCYWVIHAPKQMGKTTALRALSVELTASGRYAALHSSCQEGASAGDNFAEAQRAILSRIRHGAELYLPAELCPPPFPEAPEGTLLDSALCSWARTCPRPLVLFFDDIDALSGLSLLSVLRQLRAGFPDRPSAFPSSVVLCGLRKVRDYRFPSGESDSSGAASFFKITAESLTLRDFTRDEVAELYQQHTTDTGQVFLHDAIERAFYWTQGQPWLVNAIARQMAEQLMPDRSQALTDAHVDAAKEVLLQCHPPHLDNLVQHLREPRVRRILDRILAGLSLGDVPEDDLRFIQELGLVRMARAGGLEISNPLYREIVLRA